MDNFIKPKNKNTDNEFGFYQSGNKYFTNIIEEFSSFVACYPNNTAIDFNEQKLSFKELDDYSNQIAHFLLETHSLQPDDVVAIVTNKSLTLVPLILGILKSGAAYLPIDQKFPETRKAYMVQDSGCKLIIDNKKFDNIVTQLPSFPTDAIKNKINPCNLAYIMYTSGSTGKPKGVMVEHRNLFSRMKTERSLVQLTPSTCFITNYVFDVSLLEIFLPLITGGTINIPTEEIQNSFPDLLNFFHQKRINILQVTPSFLWALVSEIKISPELMCHLKLICIGGESLSEKLFNSIKELMPHVRVNNHYGPTETTIDAIVYEDIQVFTENIIGFPINETSVIIVDSTNKEVKNNEVGEILIGGEGVARGYINAEKLTAEKFILDPTDPTLKLYRTGDLGRRVKGNMIEFFGRKDDQVKIRGQRIELGEIESIINNCELVKQACVLVNEINNEKKLEAFIVLEKSVSIEHLSFHTKDILSDTSSLPPRPDCDFESSYNNIIDGVILNYLKNNLPDYMVPRLNFTENIPLTTNGKIDKNLLINNIKIVTEAKSVVLPANKLEKQMLNIWESILDTNIGTDNNFFEMGGHSLLAIQLIGKIRKELNLQIDINHIFEYPTISSLCKSLEDHQSKKSNALIPSKLKDSYHCTLNQERLFKIYQLNPDSTSQNESFSMELSGDIKIEVLHDSIKYLINRHDSLKTNFKIENNVIKQFIRNETNIEIAFFDFSHLKQPIEKMVQMININENKPFALEKDNLYLITIFKLQETNWQVNFILHHIITDDRSNEILKNELETIYNSVLKGMEPEMPKLSIGIKDYAEFQKNNLSNDQLVKNKNYWLELFDGYKETQLPLDFQYKNGMSYKGGLMGKTIDKNLLSKIRQLGMEKNVSVNMIFLTAISHVICNIAKCNDVLIGMAYSERDEHESLNNIVGFFISPLIIKTSVVPNEPFVSLLTKTRKNLLKAISHGSYPILDLIEEIKIPFDYSKYPITPISCNYFNYTKDPTKKPDNCFFSSDKMVEYELNFEIEEFEDDLKIKCTYRNELFKKQTVEKIIFEIESVISSNF